MNSLIKGRFFTFLAILILLVLAPSIITNATPPDSLRTRWINGQKFLMHKVIAKDTWTSVARKYKITITDLQQANKGVSVLKIGQIIQIPASSVGNENPPTIVEKGQVPTPAKLEIKKSDKKEVVSNFKYHIVQKGETLYRISKENNTTVDELKKLNNLNSNNVSVGQKLKVNSQSVESLNEPNQIEPATHVVTEIPKEVKPVVKTEIKNETKPVVSESSNPAVSEPVKLQKVDTQSVYSTTGNSRSSVTENDSKSGVAVDKITETGVATWLTDGELNQNKFYALHRNAPIGTIIKVTNRMNNNYVFVKVVGLLPDTGDNANIIIKITQAAAQRIGAIDQRFQAELSYGVTK